MMSHVVGEHVILHVIGRACDVACQVAAPQSLSYNGLICYVTTGVRQILWQ